MIKLATHGLRGASRALQGTIDYFQRGMGAEPSPANSNVLAMAAGSQPEADGVGDKWPYQETHLCASRFLKKIDWDAPTPKSTSALSLCADLPWKLYGAFNE